MKPFYSFPKLFLLLLFVALSISSYAQYGPFYTKERKLESYSHFSHYLQIIKGYNASREIENALVKIDSLASIALSHKDYSQYLFLKNEVSNFYKFGNRFNEGYTDLYNAMHVYANHADTISLEYAVSLRLLRGLLSGSNNPSRGEEEMLKSQLTILDSLGIEGEPMTNTLVDYGLFLNRKGQANESIDMLYQARTTALANNDIMSLAIADYSIISNTSRIDLEHTTIEVLKNDLSLLKKAPQSFPALVYTSFFNYMLGSRYYWNVKDINKSIEYLLNTTQGLDTLQYPVWNLKATSHSLLAQCYADLNDTVNMWHHFRIAKDVAGSQSMSDYNRGLAYITLAEAALQIASDSSQTVLDILKNHKASEHFKERIIKNQVLIYNQQGLISQTIEKIGSQFVCFDMIDDQEIPSLSDSTDITVQLEFFKILNTSYAKLDNQRNGNPHKNVILNIISKQNDLYRRIVQNEVFGLEISSIIAEYNGFINNSLAYILSNFNPKTDQELVVELFFSSKAIQLNNNLGKSILQGQMENDSINFLKLLSAVNGVNRIKTDLASNRLSDEDRDDLNLKLNAKLIESLITRHRLNRNLKHDIQSISIPTLEQVQYLIAPNQGIIEFCHDDTTLNWILITANDLKVGQKVVPDLKSRINREIYEIKTGGNDSELGEILFCQSIESDIAALSSLIIVPSSELAQLPFEWMKPPSQSKRLVKTHTISYSYSTSLWHRAKSDVKKVGSPTLLSVAPFVSEGSRDAVQLASDYRGSIPLPPLNSSKEEVESIANLFELHNTSVLSLIGEQATERNLEPLLNKFHILHLATHGLVNRNNPERSGLYLFPTEDSETDLAFEENFLSLAKLQNLTLSANLAVLSACNTGAGTVAEGEGVMALPRGFIFAGVPNVIASLWRVHDERTMELMVAFYTHLLNGKSYAEALQQAKIDCIAKGFLPLDWAGFVLIGV